MKHVELIIRATAVVPSEVDINKIWFDYREDHLLYEGNILGGINEFDTVEVNLLGED